MGGEHERRRYPFICASIINDPDKSDVTTQTWWPLTLGYESCIIRHRLRTVRTGPSSSSCVMLMYWIAPIECSSSAVTTVPLSTSTRSSRSIKIQIFYSIWEGLVQYTYLLSLRQKIKANCQESATNEFNVCNKKQNIWSIDQMEETSICGFPFNVLQLVRVKITPSRTDFRTKSSMHCTFQAYSFYLDLCLFHPPILASGFGDSNKE